MNPDHQQSIAAAAAGLSAASTAYQARQAIRRGDWVKHTSGLASRNAQGNIAILPEALAGDFLRFCQRNTKPCPLLAVSDVGSTAFPALGADLDVRTDVPCYRVWRRGELVDEPLDVRAHWRDDLVSFAIGCSFSFEEALLAEGIEVRHIARGCNVPMYRTSIPTQAAGPFAGPLVVSMRPFKAVEAIRAIQITTRFPQVHGAPVHLGDPALIGIADLSRPDYGDAVPVHDDDIPVFWACGVTPQSVIAASRPAFCITHAPGHMLVTDLKNHQLAIL